jgi:hypothetical protein
LSRLKTSGVASQFAAQISGIAMQSPHLICNLLHKITPKLKRNMKKKFRSHCVKNFENLENLVYDFKNVFEYCRKSVKTIDFCLRNGAGTHIFFRTLALRNLQARQPFDESNISD